MNEYTAYCGLDCEACQARRATLKIQPAHSRGFSRELAGFYFPI